ncbi:hypothetical protein FM104_03870 [Microbacterium esteraromaticum]|uniref:Uncharacterized protein n=1 Tax=Microbacterium esteraromaticum TaxID=57043 RepID=A0A1R4IT84_9MICO|nr:hypothetical protein [Microbacterium esteraromaticum]SJN23070.1 hypothetical protein FM104_03870 [Microbacterium esteraromaticum]
MSGALDDLANYSLEDLNAFIRRMELGAIAAARGQGPEAADTLGELYELRDRVWERQRAQEWERQRERDWHAEIEAAADREFAEGRDDD